MHFLDWIFLVIAVLIIIITLIQGGKGEGASSSIMGGLSNAHSFATMKERGTEKALTRITFVLAGLFFFMAVAVRVLL
ncbi:preprotein translocase subunit SecG [bacterium]|jgi:preprotein translocase subunit SecG|nr:preprotein translocase subunit SecG [bacterium]